MRNATLATVLGCMIGQVAIGPATAIAQAEIIPRHATWHYLGEITNGRSGSPQEDYPLDAAGRQWFDPAFDITSSTPDIGEWRVGQTIIGGGILNVGAVQTEVPQIDNRQDGFSLVTTLLFRRSFTVSAAKTHASVLEVSLLADDAGILYLNGSEVLRHNLPAGKIRTDTYALESGNEKNYDVFALPPTMLRDGKNHVAFELHNVSDFNNDMGFDLSLRAIVPEPRGAIVFAVSLVWFFCRGRRGRRAYRENLNPQREFCAL